MHQALWALQYCPTIPYSVKLAIVADEQAFAYYLQRDDKGLSQVLSFETHKAKEIFTKTDECLKRLDLERWHQLLAKNEFHYLDFFSNYYPKSLKYIEDPPLGLWLKGNVDCLNATTIAVIGSRKATPYGLHQCTRFCSRFIEENCLIISGLAYGIDTHAHIQCVEKNAPTIAVLGSGIKRLYPQKNVHLAENIIENGGAIISEYQPFDSPLPWHFPERNRIISGLADAILIVEATLKSGSLITANHAAQQAKTVFAVPANADNKTSRGCHQLIKEGAFLADTPNDILASLGISALDAPKEDRPNNPILTLLTKGPLHIDKIVHLSGLTTGEVSSMLSQLELTGSISRYNNGQYYVK